MTRPTGEEHGSTQPDGTDPAGGADPAGAVPGSLRPAGAGSADGTDSPGGTDPAGAVRGGLRPTDVDSAGGTDSPADTALAGGTGPACAVRGGLRPTDVDSAGGTDSPADTASAGAERGSTQPDGTGPGSLRPADADSIGGTGSTGGAGSPGGTDAVGAGVGEAGPTGIGQRVQPPHPRPFSLVGSYVYSYDVAAPSRPATVTRPIPSMRPSYDAEHPNSATPIYDALYSEYRRLFRALPGDRSGEENMRFTGFAIREPQQVREALARGEASPYPQQQSFHSYPGHTQGAPHFMPAQAQHSVGAGNSGGGTAGAGHSGGWVAAGYLGPTQSAAQSATQSAATNAGGRHRSMLSLPPGRGQS